MHVYIVIYWFFFSDFNACSLCSFLYFFKEFLRFLKDFIGNEPIIWWLDPTISEIPKVMCWILSSRTTFFITESLGLVMKFSISTVWITMFFMYYVATLFFGDRYFEMRLFHGDWVELDYPNPGDIELAVAPVFCSRFFSSFTVYFSPSQVKFWNIFYYYFCCSINILYNVLLIYVERDLSY